MRMVFVIAALIVLPLKALTDDRAEDRQVGLYAPPGLIESGLLGYALPRFSLKTQVRVTLLDTPDGAHLVFGETGRVLFEEAGQVWALKVTEPEHKGAARLAEWFASEIGRNTVIAFAPKGTALFRLPEVRAPVTADIELTGDPGLGHRVSREKCTRCHAVDDETRWSSIGSTPSFRVLRSLPGWQERFSFFYVLNPHPAFTQIEDVTEPFDDSRPSPIVPIAMTLDEIEAMLAYVAGLAPVDLGGALISK